MKDPAAFCEMLKSKHGYKLKGVSDSRSGWDILLWTVLDMEKMMDVDEHLFGEKPMGYSSP